MIEWPHGLKVVPIRDWPGVPTPRRRQSSFDSPMRSTMETLTRELRALNATDVELQVAIAPGDFRLDGRPRANAKATHPGLILTFTARGIGALSYPCDTFERWEDNLRAIALALESLRRVDRYGVTKRGEQYRGFMAIEATAAPAAFRDAEEAVRHLRDVVGVTGTEGMQAVPLVRQAKRITHPDHGGTASAFQRVMLAEQKLRAEGLIR